MSAILNRVLLMGYIGTFCAASTCYISDLNILGSGNVIISNVLKCASKARQNSEPSITTCMDETYPSYGLVSAICLDCITDVMQSSIGNSCLPKCIDNISSSDCNACSPSIVEEWTLTCNKGLSSPVDPHSGSDGSADTPIEAVCTDSDKSLIDSGSLFVVPSLNCLKDLATFPTCLSATVPYYSSISAGCKACAAATSTADGVRAEDCGAICMQQPVNSSECSRCADGLTTSFDYMCLGLRTSSSSGTSTTTAKSTGIFSISVVVALIAGIVIN